MTAGRLPSEQETGLAPAFRFYTGNLYEGPPGPGAGETFAQPLLCCNPRTERIVSRQSPDTGRQSQDQDGWVVLLEGR